jgi:hypothetical protein
MVGAASETKIVEAQKRTEGIEADDQDGPIGTGPGAPKAPPPQ